MTRIARVNKNTDASRRRSCAAAPRAARCRRGPCSRRSPRPPARRHVRPRPPSVRASKQLPRRLESRVERCADSLRRVLRAAALEAAGVVAPGVAAPPVAHLPGPAWLRQHRPCGQQHPAAPHPRWSSAGAASTESGAPLQGTNSSRAAVRSKARGLVLRNRAQPERPPKRRLRLPRTRSGPQNRALTEETAKLPRNFHGKP